MGEGREVVLVGVSVWGEAEVRRSCGLWGVSARCDLWRERPRVGIIDAMEEIVAYKIYVRS